MTEEPFQPFHVGKPWGSEFVWANYAGYAAKVLTIYPGQRLSLQLHDRKDETILVLAGPVLVHHGKGNQAPPPPTEFKDGDVIRIRPGTIHRFEAPEGVKVTLIEASTDDLDDVIRLEDDYDRDDGVKIDTEGFIRRTAKRDFSS